MFEGELQVPTASEERDWRCDPHELGARGERVAVESLKKRGWRILQTNWRSGYGEIDIVALDPRASDSTVVLVEVKTRRANAQGDVMPEEAVDEQRQARYLNAATELLRAYAWASVVRFDVIAIVVTPDGMAHLHHVKNAYAGDR